jgi:hypothetical protein
MKNAMALTAFLILLGSNAALAEVYRVDPQGAMRAHGLSEAEITAVLGGEIRQPRLHNDDGPIREYIYIHQPIGK